MTQHTAEPWALHLVYPPLIYGGGCIVATVDTSSPEPGERDANAERIVACVNGCAGINPEAVPGLLEALHQSIECLAWRGDETKEQLLAFIQDAQEVISAAITRAESFAE